MPSSDPRYLIFLALVASLLPFIPAGSRRLATLLVLSVAFYMGFSWWYGPLLALVTLFVYGAAILCEMLVSPSIRRGIFAIGVVGTFLPLLGFKYLGVLSSMFPLSGHIFGRSLADLALPIGISFYTFQAVGYLVDVFVGNVQAERNFVRFAAFMSFFPQLTAGPIERARHLLPQLERLGEFDYVRAVSGLRVLLLGLFMK